MIAIKNKLVATDFSATAEKALRYGRTLAHAGGGRRHVISGDFLGPFVRDPRTSEDRARRTGAARLLVGSIAEQIVRTAPCPVLAVRFQERDFVTEGDDAWKPEGPVWLAQGGRSS